MSPIEQRPAVVDPNEVAAKIREFIALEASDPRAFADALADNILDPIPTETAAFRSEELVFKSLTAALFLIENTDSVLKRRRRGSQEQRRTEYFRTAVNRERRIFENIVNGLRAQKGLLPNKPNPRRRAERRLVQENLAGDVPRGRFRQLLIEEVEADQERKRLEKERRKQARRDARRAERSN